MSSERQARGAADIPTTTFRPQKTHYFGVAFLVLLVCIALGYHLLWFSWTILLHIAYVVWINRVRTVIGPKGVTAVYLVRGSRTASWDDFRGVLFTKQGRAYAVEGAGVDDPERRAVGHDHRDPVGALGDQLEGLADGGVG